MIPGDTDDIRHDYEILLGELTTYNPELLDKQRVLAISKSDLLDEELIEMLRAELPTDLPCIFISAVTGFGITELKDLLWQQLDTAERLQQHSSSIVHRDKDLGYLQEEMVDEGEDLIIVDVEDVEDDDDVDAWNEDEAF